MSFLYRYVGPREIADRAKSAPPGMPIKSPADARHWIRDTRQVVDAADSIVATFVIDETGELRIADRRSEHVACASGRSVQSAGEIAFAVSRHDIDVAWVTNQSTGYCPAPESWPAVEAALVRAGFPAPDGFSPAFHFRRCPHCRTINVVKDGIFECDVCSSPLPAQWNLDARVTAG